LKKTKLNSRERHFFSTVYNAAFANPFSDLREKLDVKIAGLFPSASRRESKDLCIKEVDQKIKDLEKQGCTSINDFHGQDKKIITIVYMFDIFHKFRDDFDLLIKDQIKAGDTPAKVPFADRAMQMLQNRGFDNKTISHYFALSYQLRRAFYFISSSLVGSSPCMKKLKKHLWYNVFTYNIDLYNNFKRQILKKLLL